MINNEIIKMFELAVPVAIGSTDLFSEDGPTVQTNDLMSFNNWGYELRRVRKGEKSRIRDVNGTPLFHRDQTRCNLSEYEGAGRYEDDGHDINGDLIN